jgi:hypothetical protein
MHDILFIIISSANRSAKSMFPQAVRCAILCCCFSFLYAAILVCRSVLGFVWSLQAPEGLSAKFQLTAFSPLARGGSSIDDRFTGYTMCIFMSLRQSIGFFYFQNISSASFHWGCHARASPLSPRCIRGRPWIIHGADDIECSCEQGRPLSLAPIMAVLRHFVPICPKSASSSDAYCRSD